MFEIKDFARYTQILNEGMRISRKLTGMPADDALLYAAGVFTRQVLSAYSIWNISMPVPRQEFPSLQGMTAQDFVSAAIIARSMYETLLTSNYLLTSPRFDECRDVILLVSSLHSTRERIILLRTLNSKNPEFLKLIDYAAKLKNRIQAHTQFRSASSSIASYVTGPEEHKRDWRPDGIVEQAALAGFHKTQHLLIYKYFSNHVHADPMSIEQSEAIRSPNQSANMLEGVIWRAENILVQSINLHHKICVKAGIEWSIPQVVEEPLRFYSALNAHHAGLPIELGCPVCEGALVRKELSSLNDDLFQCDRDHILQAKTIDRVLIFEGVSPPNIKGIRYPVGD